MPLLKTITRFRLDKETHHVNEEVQKQFFNIVNHILKKMKLFNFFINNLTIGLLINSSATIFLQDVNNLWKCLVSHLSQRSLLSLAIVDLPKFPSIKIVELDMRFFVVTLFCP